MLHSQPIWSLSKSNHCIENEIIYKTEGEVSPLESVIEVAHEIRTSFKVYSLEASVYSPDKFGQALAYENLYLDGYPLLSLFRAGFVGAKSGPNLALRTLEVQQALKSIYTYADELYRFWYFDEEKVYEFSPRNKGMLTFMDFLYFRAVLQNSDLACNLGFLLQQYKYITDASHVKGATILTPAKSVCFLKYIYESSYAKSVKEILADPKLFTSLHNECFRKEDKLHAH